MRTNTVSVEQLSVGGRFQTATGPWSILEVKAEDGLASAKVRCGLPSGKESWVELRRTNAGMRFFHQGGNVVGALNASDTVYHPA